jgi:hypothetical protein
MPFQLTVVDIPQDIVQVELGIVVQAEEGSARLAGVGGLEG